MKCLTATVKSQSEEKAEYLQLIRNLKEEIVEIKKSQEKGRRDEIKRKVVMNLKK